MTHKRMLLFLSATLLWCAAATVALAQNSASQGPARLRAYTTVKKQPGGAAASRQAFPNSPQLPLWTFNVSSTRDHTNYSGVMVGRNPFGHEPRQSVGVPTQIVPVVITTNLVGTSVDNSGIIATTPRVTTRDPTVSNSACLA